MLILVKLEGKQKKMADRARGAYITLKSKRQRTEDDEDDFHFVNKLFKREDEVRICKLN